MRYALVLAALVAALGPLSCSDDAPSEAGLSLDQVVELLELGYGEADVKEAITNAGPVPRVDPTAERRLRAAGAEDGLIAFLKAGTESPAPAPAPGRVATALAALAEGEAVEAVLDRIAAARPDGPTEAPSDADREQIADAPLPVRLALAGRPITLVDLEALATHGTSEGAFAKLLALCGGAGESLSAVRALALRHAGVPSSALRAYRAGVPRSAVTAERLDATGYTHVGKRFLMKTPADWVVLRDVRDGAMRYVFTPEKDKHDIDDVDVGIVLSLGAPPEGSVWSDKSPHDLLELMLPWIRVLEPDMAPTHAIEPARLGSLAAASQSFEGVPQGRTGQYRSRVTVAEAEGLVYSVVAVAPVSAFPEWNPVFERVLRESTFARLGHPDRGNELDASAFAESCKSSVVIVRVRSKDSEAQGTGFIISKDGYVLTNWHVIWDHATGRPYETVSVGWDDSLARPEVKATVLGAYHKMSPESDAGGMLGGTDVALLKLDPGDYTPVRLSPTSTVKLGDPVINLGFPQSFTVAGLSMFVTRGVVVRFNRDVTGRTVGITVDAKHAPGSSGGPCFDLRTGGVIGLTTWSYKIGTETDAGRSANDMIGYYFLCPTDDALAHFPLVADLGYGHDKTFDFLSTYELAGQFLALSAEEAALEMADRAVELDPQSADALIQRAMCQRALAYKNMAAGESKDVERLARLAEASLERAVVAAPQRPEPRIALAALYLDLDRLENAQKHASKVVEDHPDRWDAHMVAARVCAAREEVEETVKHLDAAKKASRELLPDPFLFAGQLAYSRGWLEQGKQEYERAVAIHPGSHDANLGVADFLLHKGRWEDAIEAFEVMRGRFPRSPVPLHRSGYCRKEQNQLDEALRLYQHAEAAFKKGGIIPPEGFFLEQADIYAAQESMNEIGSLAKHLLYRGAGPQSIPVHLRLAKIYRRKDINAIGTMHVRRAILWAKEQGRDFEPVGFTTVDPDIQHLAWMTKNNAYPVQVAVDLIVNGRLKYRFPEKKAAQEKEYEKLRGNGIPHEVILAIIESNNRYPPVGDAPAKPTEGTPRKTTQPTREQPRQPPEEEAEDDEEADAEALRALTGSWRHQTIDQLLGEVDLTMTFDAGGKWQSKGVMGGFRVDDSGSFTATRSSVICIVRRSTNPVVRPGTTRSFSFQVTADVLKLFDPRAKQWITFKRVR